MRNPRFAALFRNELEKLWAHRLRALIIAFCVIVIGGSLLEFRSYEASLHQAQQNIQQIKSQVSQLRRQESHATGKQKQAIQQNLQQIQQVLQQVESQSSQNPHSINVANQLKMLRTQLSQQPSSQRGATLEQIAVAKSELAHGVRQVDPNVSGAFKVVGEVFAGMAMLIFGLVAAGIGSDSVSAELEGGTFGVLLLHAPRRMQVYGAKLAAAVSMMWGFMLASALGFLLLLGALIGFGNATYPIVVGVHYKPPLQPGISGLTVPPQVFHIVPQWTFDIWALVLAMLAMAAMQCIFLALSTLTRSTVFSLIVGAVLVLSGVMAPVVAQHIAWLAIVDPAVHMPLGADWSGSLASQYVLPTLSLHTGIVVLAAWAAAALLAGMAIVRRIDL